MTLCERFDRTFKFGEAIGYSHARFVPSLLRSAVVTPDLPFDLRTAKSYKFRSTADRRRNFRRTRAGKNILCEKCTCEQSDLAE